MRRRRRKATAQFSAASPPDPVAFYCTRQDMVVREPHFDGGEGACCIGLVMDPKELAPNTSHHVVRGRSHQHVMAQGRAEYP